MYDLKAIAK